MTTPLIVCILLSVLIILPAWLAAKRHDATAEDYLTAKQSIHWLPAGISAAGSMLSGFSFTALVGYAYEYGLFAIWFVLIRNVGEIIISWLVWPRLYSVSVQKSSWTLGHLAAHLTGRSMPIIQLVSGVLITFFMILYIASQLQASSIALQQTLSWDSDAFNLGIILCGLLLLLYCFWGGIRSSIYTDVPQTAIMLLALVSVPIGVMIMMGGWPQVLDGWAQNASPDYLNPFASEHILYPSIYMASLLFIGFAVLGQPHIVSRMLTVSDQDQMRKARLTYYVVAITINLLAVGVGVMARALLPVSEFTTTSGEINAEPALFMTALTVFPQWGAILIMVGALSATLSTSDSQVHAASSAFVIDLLKPLSRFLPMPWQFLAIYILNSHWALKIVTIFVGFLAIIFAITLSQHSVFDVVEVAWSVQGSFFFALFVFCVFRAPAMARLSQSVLLLAMLAGAATALIWKVLGFGIIAYPAACGILVSSGILLLKSFTQTSDENRG